MQKPTQEAIDEALKWMDSGNPASFEICEAAWRLAAAYRAKCDEYEVYIHDLESGYEAQEARAEMLERQYRELKEAYEGQQAMADDSILIRHTAEREALG